MLIDSVGILPWERPRASTEVCVCQFWNILYTTSVKRRKCEFATIVVNVKYLYIYLCRFFDIPMEVLPPIRSSSEIYGYFKESVLKRVAISGVNIYCSNMAKTVFIF